MTAVQGSNGASIETELERAESMQKTDASKAEEGFRAVLNRKARE